MGYCKEHGVFSLYCRGCDNMALNIYSNSAEFDSSVEHITEAAVIYECVTYSLPPPNRHHNLIHMLYEKMGKRMMIVCDSQGFMTSEGRYVGRKEALVIAKKANQLLPRHQHETELFSESIF
jgi:hypothetical protein